MSRYLKQYLAVLKALALNSLTFSQNKLGKNASQKKSAVRGKIGMAFIFLMVMAYGAIMSVNMTIAAYDNGIISEYYHFVVFLGQIVVLFFGGYAATNYMYFSKDNVLLATLPVSSEVLFAAKFTITYVTELLFSFVVMFPMLIASGVTMLKLNLGLPTSYFAVALLSIITAPIIPLVLVSAFAMPIMKLLAALKGKVVSSGLLFTIIYIGGMVGYFAIIGTFTNMTTDEETGITVLPAATLKMFENISKFTVFNHPIADALLGKNVAAYTLSYLGMSIVILALIMFVSRFLYRKGVMYILETNGTSKETKEKRNRKSEFTTASPMKALLVKEVRTLIKSPMLLMSTLLTMCMPPLLMFAFKFMLPTVEDDEEFMNSFVRGMTVFICYLLIAGANQAALIGFSREGKSILLTRSLPISAKVIINSKLLFATSITLISSLICAIIFPFATNDRSVIGAIGLFIFLVTGGFGMNTINLLSDLKNPNFRWNNINELTKNNTKSLKPMLIAIAIGIITVVAQVVLSLFDIFSLDVENLIYFAICTVIVLPMAIFGYRRLIKKYPEYMKNVEV